MDVYGIFKSIVDNKGNSKIVLYSIILVFLSLGLFYSNVSMWSDELASLRFSDESMSHLWSIWMVRETNPPLYYNLLKMWRFIFGSSDFALRSFSITASLAGLAVLFYLTKEAGGVSAALLAVLLLTFSLPHLNYSLQIRCYVLAQTFAMVSLLAVIRFVKEVGNLRRRRLWLGVYVISTTLALYSHTTLVFLPVVVNLCWLSWFCCRWRTNQKVAVEWILSQVSVVSLWSWWGYITWLQLHHGSPNINWIPKVGIREAWWIVRDAFAPAIQGANLITLIFLGLAAYAVIKVHTFPVFLLTVAAFGAPVLIFVSNFFTPIMLLRTIFWATAPFTAILSIGILALPGRKAQLIVASSAVILSAVGVVMNSEKLQTEPWHAAVQQIAAKDPKATVLADEMSYDLVRRYCEKPICSLKIVQKNSFKGDNGAGALLPGAKIEHISALLNHGNVVYLVDRGKKVEIENEAGLQTESIHVRGDWLHIISITRVVKHEVQAGL
jgi:mannosyltransferase